MKAREARANLERLEANIEKVIRGKTDVVRMSILGLLAGGHLLFEDVPGVGKTTLSQCVARSLGLSFQRIQFTSDLLPSDILGVTIYDSRKGEFEFRPGPIFANVVLVDEINRTTPKTQSALLEAMHSAQVSVEKTTHDLPRPFMVIATQNPVESHGTFPLPTSQLDRFLLRLHVGYPEPDDERRILMEMGRTDDLAGVSPVLSCEEVEAMQAGVRDVAVSEPVADYVVRLARATREDPAIETGISTRGALALRRAAQACAYFEGRDFCTPDDVKRVAVASMAHRIVPVRAFEGGADGIGIGSEQIRAILAKVPVPA